MVGVRKGKLGGGGDRGSAPFPLTVESGEDGKEQKKMKRSKLMNTFEAKLKRSIREK